MIDPSRLLDSATRVYGDQMDRLWGEFAAVPEANIVLLSGGETIQAGGRAFDVDVAFDQAVIGAAEVQVVIVYELLRNLDERDVAGEAAVVPPVGKAPRHDVESGAPRRVVDTHDQRVQGAGLERAGRVQRETLQHSANKQ